MWLVVLTRGTCTVSAADLYSESRVYCRRMNGCSIQTTVSWRYEVGTWRMKLVCNYEVFTGCWCDAEC